MAKIVPGSVYIMYLTVMYIEDEQLLYTVNGQCVQVSRDHLGQLHYRNICYAPLPSARKYTQIIDKLVC